MMQLLFTILFIYIGYKIFKALTATRQTGTGEADSALSGVETVQDPICGVYLAKEDAVVGNLEGTRHYFCSMDCLNKFQEQIDQSPPSNPGGTP